MKRQRHKYIIYFSIFFVMLALYQGEYIKIPIIFSPVHFCVSFIFLFLGFLFNAVAQQLLLTKSEFAISMPQAIAMTGLNIFGKYIPGKMWMVMGNAVYVSEKCGYPLTQLSIQFFRAQIIGLWCGLVLGIIGLILIKSTHILNWVGIVFILVFSLIIFSKKAHVIISIFLNKIFKKDFNLPILSFGDTVSLLPIFTAGWLFWGIGFISLTASLTKTVLTPSIIFCFPLAGTLGVISLFSPGGIGVREGIIVYYLSLCNIDLTDAVTISAVSRLWFLIGEILIFITGYIAEKRDLKISNRNRSIH